MQSVAILVHVIFADSGWSIGGAASFAACHWAQKTLATPLVGHGFSDMYV